MSKPVPFFMAMKLAASDFQFYRTLAVQPLRRSLLFFVQFMLLVSLFLGIRLAYTSMSYWEDFKHILTVLPALSIKEGAFYTQDGKQVQSLSKTHNRLTVSINPDEKTTATVRESADNKPHVAIVIHDKKLYLSVIKDTVEHTLPFLDLSTLPEARLNDQLKTILKAQYLIFVSILPITVFFVFSIMKILQILFFSSLYYAMTRVSVTEPVFPYLLVFTVGVYANVAPTILYTAVSALDVYIPYADFVYIAVFLIFMTMAFRAILPPEKDILV